jgi:hypothetical protein
MDPRLTRALRPPEQPRYVPSADDFAALVARVGTALPADYRELWETYGAGALGAFLGILRPVGPPPFYGTVGFALEALREIAIGTGWTAYPGPSGLIPWGQTDNGDYLAWRTGGDPASWIVAVVPRSGDVEFHAMSMTSFLAQWALGTLPSAVFPDDVERGFVQAPWKN